MKVSEGIRLGSVGRKQVTGVWGTKDGGVCAIGALMAFLGFNNDNLYIMFPALINTKLFGSTRMKPDPQQLPLIEHIIDRNEKGDSFQQIIEWLESIGQ